MQAGWNPCASGASALAHAAMTLALRAAQQRKLALYVQLVCLPVQPAIAMAFTDNM